MFSTYKKAVKEELLRQGYWTAAEFAVGKREFNMFMRAYLEKTYKNFKGAILHDHWKKKFSPRHPRFNGITYSMFSELTNKTFAYSVAIPNKGAVARKIVEACRKVK